MILSKKEITDIMKMSSLALVKRGGIVEPIITADWDTAHRLGQVDTLVRSILRSSITELKSSEAYRRYIENLQRTDLPFLCYLKANLDRVRREHPWHRFHPHIELFASTINDGVLPPTSPELTQASRVYGSLDPREKLAMAHRWADATQEMRRQGMTRAFKAKVENFARLGNKNHKELAQYVSLQFRSHTSIFAVRAELGYTKADDWPAILATDVDFKKVQQHLSIMTGSMKSTFARDLLVGYAYKIDHGLHKGFQTQALFLFDGEQVEDAAAIIKRIGTLWQTDATGGTGLFYNCGNSKTPLRARGSGLVLREDKDAREGLRKAIACMTKADRYMVVKAPKGIRAFRKGIISCAPTVSDKRVAHAPRQPRAHL